MESEGGRMLGIIPRTQKRTGMDLVKIVGCTSAWELDGIDGNHTLLEKGIDAWIGALRALSGLNCPNTIGVSRGMERVCLGTVDISFVMRTFIGGWKRTFA